MRREIEKLIKVAEKEYNTILRLDKNPIRMDTEDRWVVVYANTNYKFTSGNTLEELKENLKFITDDKFE